MSGNIAEFCKKFNEVGDTETLHKCIGYGPVKWEQECVEWYSNGDQRSHVTILVCPRYCKYRSRQPVAEEVGG